MHWQKLLRIAGWSWLLLLAGTLVLVLWRGHRTLVDIVNDATIVGMALGILGLLMRKGAGTGDGPMVDQMVASVSSTPAWLRNADGEDMLAGISTGLVLVVAALGWIGLVAVVYTVLH